MTLKLTPRSQLKKRKPIWQFKLLTFEQWTFVLKVLVDLADREEFETIGIVSFILGGKKRTLVKRNLLLPHCLYPHFYWIAHHKHDIPVCIHLDKLLTREFGHPPLPCAHTYITETIWTCVFQLANSGLDIKYEVLEPNIPIEHIEAVVADLA